MTTTSSLADTRATTAVRLSRGTVPGSPVRVDATDGLLAVRTVSRGAVRAEVALVATGAVLLGGDHVVVRVDVADGCALRITDVGGTVAYDGEGAACRWDVEVRLGRGARLDWAGMPLVVAGGADVVRATTVRLGAGARLVLRETVVLGRDGEHGGRVVVRSDVADDVGPVLVEEVVASGTAPVPGVLGPYRVLDTLTDVHATDELEALEESDLPGPVPGATTLRLDRGGTVTRWLGSATHLSPVERALAHHRPKPGEDG
ncbi:urease accessory protein UreD [Isoptericola sp. S6320L]|uniref:urease accessory protein UreD n=1 Tax=Isoptericola sp. S6320L TaxID=2926411 RepID=UPI001FF59BFB|nr:urease accessory protein UreD [Isoptericola sp. S6320L]MCK0117929.1 urease accessory protein UreD [Isoptericola sp. S6320L]